MSGVIRPIPELPHEIIEAVNQNKLSVFIGAGISRLLGCSGWDELGRKLAGRCFSEGVINYREKESLIEIKDSRKVLTICHSLLKESSKEDIFFEEMEKALKEDQEISIPNVYDDIYKLRGLFVTTNADRHFHKNFRKPNILYDVEKLDKENIDRANLYHIHGCISERTSMVFTLQSYFKRYRETPSFEQFLRAIFDSHTILFLGYGLSEYELLEYLFMRHDNSKSRELKHFMLMGFNGGEERILGFEQRYYGEMGIKVLPYRKDERGYNQIEIILKEWSKAIGQISNYLPTTFEAIDRLIENGPQ